MNTKQPDTLILELNDLRTHAETASSTGWIYRDTYEGWIDKCNQVIGKVNSITGLQLSPRQITLSDLSNTQKTVKQPVIETFITFSPQS